MTTSIKNLNPDIVSPSSYGVGKLYVPVNKNQLMYSHFSHISGVQVSENQTGVSITKIQILNSLIERVSAIKNESVKVSESENNINSEKITALIKNYQEQIQKAVKSPYLANGAKPQPGDLFSFSV